MAALSASARPAILGAAKANAAALSTSAANHRGDISRLPRGELRAAADLAALRKGPGYRSSFSGMVSTVFGSTGCIGRGVCNRLGKSGSQMIIPYRGDHYKYMRLKVCGDLGQVLFTPYEVTDEDSIRRSMEYSNVAINLVGREYPTMNFSFKDINVDAPARLARIAKEMGVERFVHISSINARENPESVFLLKGSDWLRTKWEGEQRVLQEFPDATIFRPTDVYGQSDAFIWHYFSWGRRGYRFTMPLWKKGEETLKAPLYFSDLAEGIIRSLDDPAAKGTIYEAFGPETYKLCDLINYMCGKTQRDTLDYGHKITDLRMAPVAFAKAIFYQSLPSMGNETFGKHSIDKLERDSLSDDITYAYPNLSDLGVKTAPVTERMPFEMQKFVVFPTWRPATIAEEPDVPDPAPVSRVEVKRIRRQNQESLLGQLGLAA